MTDEARHAEAPDLRVLVVDDEPGMREGVARALEGFTVRLPAIDDEIHGFEVQTADTGERCVALVTSDAPPDLVLLDIKLPGMSGLEVLARVDAARHQSATMFVMITGYATIETAVVATKRGAYDVLPKPFTPDEVRTVVRKAAQHLLANRKAERLARERRRVRFEFISVLAHELKAPLAAVEGYLDIMKQHTLGPEIQTYDRIVERCLVRVDGMRKLIFDLLDLTRIESGQKKRTLGEVDLVAVARSVLETMEPAARDKRVTLELDGPERLAMVGDEGELQIILNNLVSNAVKYNRDGGRVWVRLRREGDWVVVEVQDTGIGMTKEEAGRLFQEFVRIKNEKTRDILGSGLGLSIVKRIARLYRGDVSVRSEPDVGSTFTVRLAADDGEGEPC